MSNKKSFFEKLTGSIKFRHVDDEHDFIDDEYLEDEEEFEEDDENEYHDSLDEVGELSVDMYRNDSAIIIKAMVAGIEKSDINITLSRDRVQIEGSRSQNIEGKLEEIYFEELFWGSFERTLDLPEEIDIELAEAHEQHGLLTLILPLIDKDRQTRIRIK
ncbi:MAG: Hsp20/alpha crystallin family protein [Candidatus Pacebacteria bacterium]|nr:Hsp20/alpha crystallin family protein [Candidatus Paceibacterota bacterium]